MPGFSTYDSIINALTVKNLGQTRFYQKSNITTAAGGSFSLWNAGGIPVAGTFGTALTARTIDNTATGSIPYTNATGSNQMALLSAGLGSTQAIGVCLLVDRLLEAPFNGTVTSGSFNGGTPISIPARDVNGAANGDGCFMFVENVANTTSGAANITVTYTNQAGTNSQSTGAQALIAGAQHRILHNIGGAGLFLPLASGDTGIRKIASYTLSGSITTTQANIVVCRILTTIPLFTANAYTERDTVLQLASLPRLYNGTAMQWIFFANAAASGATFGQIVFAEN